MLLYLIACLTHSSFSNSSGMKNLASTFENPDAHQYHLDFQGAVPEPPPQKKNFLRHKYPRTFLFYRFNQSVQSPTRHLESV